MNHGRRQAVLAALRNGSRSVAAAARAAGVSRQSVYRLAQTDPVVRDALSAAKARKNQAPPAAEPAEPSPAVEPKEPVVEPAAAEPLLAHVTRIPSDELLRRSAVVVLESIAGDETCSVRDRVSAARSLLAHLDRQPPGSRDVNLVTFLAREPADLAQEVLKGMRSRDG